MKSIEPLLPHILRVERNGINRFDSKLVPVAMEFESQPAISGKISPRRETRRPTHLPSLGPKTLIPTVLTLVLNISICFSLKSPELVKVKSEKGMRTLVHS